MRRLVGLRFSTVVVDPLKKTIPTVRAKANVDIFSDN